MPERLLQAELMDDPGLDAAEHETALAGLARLNALSRADAILRPELEALARSLSRPVRLLDVACGSGDVPISLARRFHARGIEIDLTACDISQRALGIARSRASAHGVALRTIALDIVHSRPPERFDVVTCSLFLHHLDPAAAVSTLRHMADAAQSLLLVSDLRRTRVGLGLAWVASRATTRSRVVRVDAIRSVRAAWSMQELRALAEQAALTGASVRRAWPQRMLLLWRRS